MASQWYVKVSGKRAGPFSWERLKAFAQKRQFSPEDLVREEGQGPWVPAGQVEGLFGEGSSPGSGSEGSSIRVAKPLEGPGGPAEAKPLPTAKPIPEPKPGGMAEPAAPRVAEPLDEPPADAAATPSAPAAAEASATQAPEVGEGAKEAPELPAFGAPPLSTPASEFDLLIDAAPVGVAGAREGGPQGLKARRKNNLIIAAAFALMLLAVLAVGMVLSRSNAGTAKPNAPSDASAVPAPPAAEEHLREGPDVPDIEAVEAIDDLEELDIFGSTGAKPASAGKKTKKNPRKNSAQ